MYSLTEAMAIQVLVDAVLATAVEFAAPGKPAYLNVPTGLLLRGRSICSIRAAS